MCATSAALNGSSIAQDRTLMVPRAGDAVKDGDVLAQIETDKVTIDVKYTEAEGGVLTKVIALGTCRSQHRAHAWWD